MSSVSSVPDVFLPSIIKPGCTFYTHNCFLRWKKDKLLWLQISSFRWSAFATLRWPHCVPPPTPMLRLPVSATQSQYLIHFHPIPVLRLHDHPNHPCYICLRPLSRWFSMIFHAMSSLPDRWNFLIGHKPDSKESEMTLAVAQNVAKSHRKRYKSQEFNNANSYKLRSPKSVENWVSYSSPKFRGQMQKNGA